MGQPKLVSTQPKVLWPVLWASAVISSMSFLFEAWSIPTLALLCSSVEEMTIATTSTP